MPLTRLTEEKLEKFFDLVRRNDFIYNSSNRRHADSCLIESFWKNVAGTLDVDDMDAIAWQKKWRNIRDSYVKYNRRKRINGDYAPHYKFAKWLSFLDPHLPTNKTKSYGELEEDNSLSEQDCTKEEARSPTGSSGTDFPEIVWAEHLENEEDRQSSRQHHQSSFAAGASGRHDDFVLTPSAELDTVYPHPHHQQYRPPHHNDADMLLFESYALRLKALSPEAQAVIKMQMSQIFFNAENTTGDVVDIFPSRKRKASSSPSHQFQENGEITFPSSDSRT